MPAWGEMTAQHMVEHLVQTFRLSNGKIEITPAYEGRKLKVMRQFLESDKPMPKNFTNPAIGSGLKPLIFQNLEEAKSALLEETDEFISYFQKHPDATPVNPTFGALDYDGWIKFHRKHITHHFKQFGLIDDCT